VGAPSFVGGLNQTTAIPKTSSTTTIRGPRHQATDSAPMWKPNAESGGWTLAKHFPTQTAGPIFTTPWRLPPALVTAHAELDRSVDLCYRPQPFQKRPPNGVEYLFALYERLTAPLIAPAKKKPTENAMRLEYGKA